MPFITCRLSSERYGVWMVRPSVLVNRSLMPSRFPLFFSFFSSVVALFSFLLCTRLSSQVIKNVCRNALCASECLQHGGSWSCHFVSQNLYSDWKSETRCYASSSSSSSASLAMSLSSRSQTEKCNDKCEDKRTSHIVFIYYRLRLPFQLCAVRSAHVV